MIYKYPEIPEAIIRDLPHERRPKGNPGRKKRPTYASVCCAFDIETTSLRRRRQAIMYIWQFQIGYEITIMGRYWSEFLELLQRLQSLIGEDVKLVTYVHNLSFEFQFLSGIWHFDTEDVFCTEPRKILRADMGPLELRCSYRLSNMSLAEFTLQMKTQHRKLSGDRFDYEKERYPWTKLSDYELMYCANDVIGLVEAVMQMAINDSDTWYTIPMTSTGYVRRDIKRAMKTFNWQTMHRLLPPYSVHKRLKRGFRGGNTHGNRHFIGVVLHHVKSWDMASAYPAAQINKDFPMGRWYEVEPEKVTLEYLADLMGRRHKAILATIAFLDIHLEDPRWPVPYIPVDKCDHYLPIKDVASKDMSTDNGRIMAARYLEITVTDIDLRIIAEEYTWNDMKILYLAFSTYGKLPSQYREVILDYYHKKTTLKGVAGQEWLYMKSKNKLNSIYGCAVQDPIQVMYEFVEGREELPYQIKQENEEELYNKAMKYAVQSYAWGVWVTCYCRQRLEAAIRLIYEQGQKEKAETGKIKTHFIYCDTDSVKYIGEVDFEQLNAGYRQEAIKNSGYATDPKGKEHYLGVYEYEGEYADFMTWGAKKYVYREESKLQTVAGCGDTWHITIAGVNKKAGARELERRGGISALLPDEYGRPNFVFRDSGSTDAIYNDYPEPVQIKKGKHSVEVTRNLYLEPSEYTLGITDDFNRIIMHPDLWRELIDTAPVV